MSDVVLGVQPEEDASRDAIHVAVIPVVAGEMLRPGQRVGVTAGVANPSDRVHGIVDPYLTDVVPKGERFWLCLLPGTVTGMRHHWSHPDFGSSSVVSEDERAKSEKWLREQCEPLGVDFDELVGDDSDLVHCGYIRSPMNEDARDHWYEIQEEFWKHHAIYTGRTTPEENRGSFTCSC